MFTVNSSKDKVIVFLIILNIIMGLVLLYFIMFPKENDLPMDLNYNIMVHIEGEIINPGVYEINSGSRLYDLIELSGGFTENVDMSGVNMAMLLKDEMKITIPSQSTYGNIGNKVNINTADLELLQTLNGIGETKAKNIIYYREVNGPFKQIEDLIYVTGIGEKTFENIKDDICI